MIGTWYPNDGWSLDQLIDRCESVCGLGECDDLEDWQFENQDTCDRIGFELNVKLQRMSIYDSLY